MRVLVPLFIVAVIVLGGLIALRMHTRTAERRRELAALRAENEAQAKALHYIQVASRAYADSTSAENRLLADTVLGLLAELPDRKDLTP